MPLFAPRVGAAAPALELPAADGSGPRSLAHLRGRPVLVSFLGPAHCNFCRAHVIRAIQHREEFSRAGADVMFVAYHDPQLLMAQMLRDLNLPYTLLLDSSRATYRRWGLDQATWRAHLSPGFYFAVAKLALAGERKQAKAPGPVQMGGDFVVNREGRLAFAHFMSSFHDRAKMPQLLEALRKS